MIPGKWHAGYMRYKEKAMVDLSKAKKGDKVKFRCGSEAVIDKIIDLLGTVIFIFQGSDEIHVFKNNGKHRYIFDHLLDIISIEPAPFDWSTVKPGFGFEYEEGDYLCNFIAMSPFEKGVAVVCDVGRGKILSYHSTYDLVRREDLDIEVKG